MARPVFRVNRPGGVRLTQRTLPAGRATSPHQREAFSVKGWTGACVPVVGPCIAVIELVLGSV